MGKIVEFKRDISHFERLDKAITDCPGFKINPATRSYVYFIQEGKRGPIKIGLSSDPLNRLNTMQTGNATNMRLLLILNLHPDKAINVESRFHKYFGVYRIRGEWFRASRSIVTYICDELDWVSQNGDMLPLQRGSCEQALLVTTLDQFVFF